MPDVKRRLGAFTLCLLLCLPGAASAGAYAINLYPHLADVDSDSDLTLSVFTPLPARLSYFSFINFGGVLHGGKARFQITEQNLYWNALPGRPFDLVLQDTIRYGHDNDTLHAGLRWRVGDTGPLRSLLEAAGLDYSLQVFPVRADQRELGGWQISHVYQLRFPWLSDRLYFSGFLDHNIDESAGPGRERDNVVSENQLGFRLYKGLYAVAEFRVNDYRRFDTTNFGAGLELKAAW